MRSRQLDAALGDYFAEAGAYLRAELAAGAEVPFELGTQSARRGGSATLYCYRALTGEFISEREPALKRLPGHAETAKLLEHFDGIDSYLASVGGEAARAKARSRVRATIKALLEEVFDEQSDFELRAERVEAALARLHDSTFASASELTLVASLHGVTIASAELPLTKGLRIVQRDASQELPDAGPSALESELTENHLIVVYTAEPEDAPEAALLEGRAVLKDLLSALRLFGDGRVSLGALAWARIGSGSWTPLALGAGGRPRGMLVVTAEQEDELRAFCNLVSRRAPHDNDLAWALRRFELGCERETPYEGLTDNLLALRALLEPEGPASARLAGRLAAICATAEERPELTERMTRALALERSLIAGTATKNAASQGLADEVANHLRSLLRDVICGHLDPDLAVIADELLEPDELLHSDDDTDFEDAWPEHPDEHAAADHPHEHAAAPVPVRAPVVAAATPVLPEAADRVDALEDAALADGEVEDTELDYAEPGYEAPAPAGEYAAARLAAEEDFDSPDSDEAELLAATGVAEVPRARAAEHGWLERDSPADEARGDSPEPDEQLPIDGVVSTLS
ncbi:MAG TPA: hypothetical protein VG188_03260 [Solirubrobacteraceae bacterium]|nr:hypothetical protein [Solirubrobacteraceae bacterium]